MKLAAGATAMILPYRESDASTAPLGPQSAVDPLLPVVVGCNPQALEFESNVPVGTL